MNIKERLYLIKGNLNGILFLVNNGGVNDCIEMLIVHIDEIIAELEKPEDSEQNIIFKEAFFCLTPLGESIITGLFGLNGPVRSMEELCEVHRKSLFGMKCAKTIAINALKKNDSYKSLLKVLPESHPLIEILT